MTRFIAGLIMITMVFAVLYFAALRPSHHPLLIDGTGEYA